MTTRPRVLGAVLAGGASSRFGSDKALAQVGGMTLLARAEAALAEVTDAVVVVGRGAVADLPVPGLGPLGGIAGALDHAARHGFASVLTIGCDMPEVPPVLLAALLAEAPAYCPDAPVLGHWPVALAAELIDHLAVAIPSPRVRPGIHGAAGFADVDHAGPWMPGRAWHEDGGKDRTLSVRRWATAIGAVAIPAQVPLRNVNTPADLPAS